MSSYLSEPNTASITYEDLLNSLNRTDITDQQKGVIIQELTRKNLVELNKSINNFNSSSEKYSKGILFLTYVLVFETTILLIPVFKDFCLFVKTFII